MALPKGKISKARKHSRRANWKLELPGIGKCPQCGQMKLSHRVCKNCGYYNGVQVIVSKDEEKNARLSTAFLARKKEMQLRISVRSCFSSAGGFPTVSRTLFGIMAKK